MGQKVFDQQRAALVLVCIGNAAYQAIVVTPHVEN
jgi:hypothetical protein